MTTRWYIWAALGAACVARGALAQGEWLLIDRDLGQLRVELIALGDGALSCVDPSGRPRRAPVDDLLAAVHLMRPADRPPRELPWITRQLEQFGPVGPPRAGEAEPFEGVLELTDGQRWVGDLVSGRGESVSWLIEGTLLLDAPLERVRSAAIAGPIDGPRAAWDGRHDRLVLTNGDVLEGFVESLAAAVRFERGGESADIDLARVEGVFLANPPIEPGGTIVRSLGGSVIAVTALEITMTGQVRAEVEGQTLVGGLGLRASDLLSVNFAPDAYAGLASIKPASAGPPGLGSWSPPPTLLPDETLGIPGLELRGPVRVEWVLPRPAARFAATAELPPAAWAWGDCELVVRGDDGRELARERLRAERPSVEVNVPLGSMRGLILEIESGAGGPVQDRVVLHRPIITWR